MKGTPDTILQWERERARLSHDTLKNELIPMLSKAIRVMDGIVQDDEFQSMLPSQIQSLCMKLCDGIISILDSLGSRLSPARYFEMLPLVGFDEESKRWLSEIVEAGWKESVPHVRLVEGARSQENRVKEVLQSLNGWHSKEPSARNALLRDLLLQVRELGNKLAKLKTLLPYPI